MDNDYGIDLAEIRRVIGTADVLIVRFAIVEQRLLIDTRTNDVDGPLIKVVPRVQSMEERLEGLQKLRPRFPIPDRIMSFWWPRHIESLQTSGVWNAVSERMAATGDARSVERAQRVYRELLGEERREVRRAIRGEGYQSLWESRV